MVQQLGGRNMGVRGTLALFAVILLVCHAFVLPAVSSRPLHDELERELLVSESTDVEATVHESEKLAADQSSLQQVSYSDTYCINVAFNTNQAWNLSRILPRLQPVF
jgi:hypothetical protein